MAAGTSQVLKAFAHLRLEKQHTREHEALVGLATQASFPASALLTLWTGQLFAGCVVSCALWILSSL